MIVFPFERLHVWKESRGLVKRIYRSIESFPRKEEYGLKDQIRRASISVSLNLVEGTARQRGKEQANYYKYSFSSLMEVMSGLILATDLGYLDEQVLQELKIEIAVLAKRINALRKATLKSNTK